MAGSTFEYSALRTDVKEIRLLTLLPGLFEDDLQLRLRHVELKQPGEPTVSRLSIAELQKTLPAGHHVHETSQYQFRYLFDRDDTYETSWSHPDENVDPSAYQPLSETPTPEYEPSFEALSYTWGNANELETAFIVNEEETRQSCGKLKIRRNLAQALRHLRYESASRTLWTDALCINQNDDLERSSQVQLMSNIYQYAMRVVIWLGPASANSSLAMSTLQYLGQQLEIDSKHIRYRSPGASEPDWFRSVCPLPYDKETWQAIENLVHRDYFERLWIWQEVSLANSRAVVFCGKDEVPWQILGRAIVCLKTKDVLPSATLRNRLFMVEAVTHDRRDFYLRLLLIISRERKCSDPRDHIYGIMSIAGPALSRHIMPDYTKDTAKLFQEVAEIYVETTNRLDLIACCDLSLPNPRHLASWVPDWHIPLNTYRLSTFMLASGISSSEARFLDDALLTKGFTVATVGSVSDGFGCDLKRMFHRMKTMRPRDADEAYVTGGSVFEAFLRTLRVGYLDETWPTLSAPTYEEWQDDFWERVVDSDETLLNDAEFMWCLNLIKGRMMIRSTAGHIGLGPPNTHPGDIICTLLGLQSQLMIRRASSDTYQIVGECYLHGTDNCIPFLGPLPDGWIPFYDKRDSGYGVARKYRKPSTGEVIEDDPRLPPLREWERFHRESQPDDRGSFACFRNKRTGGVINADPRLTATALREMGLEVEDFCFV
ncbi:hypothetical protein PRZ48_014241 [Zasmidium cellare]|uniref:Heterokaryon incompatibility domain-containing protein n=1 Tax=Zasmidium cellare TaxID=395010 RepID=A0ABR0E0E8_ZASCE|nr:hypothetical protein PRZ48_014241 [Zasmidium cellare]